MFWVDMNFIVQESDENLVEINDLAEVIFFKLGTWSLLEPTWPWSRVGLIVEIYLAEMY
jgi:hypothetical protein